MFWCIFTSITTSYSTPVTAVTEPAVETEVVAPCCCGWHIFKTLSQLRMWASWTTHVAVYLCTCWDTPLSVVVTLSYALYLQAFFFYKKSESQVRVHVLFEFVHTAVEQTKIHFCPLSQVISSPHININAYRDTVQRSSYWSKGRSHKPSGKVLKLASYCTPAGQLWASWVQNKIWKIHRILRFPFLFILLFSQLIHWWRTLVHWPHISRKILVKLC